MKSPTRPLLPWLVALASLACIAAALAMLARAASGVVIEKSRLGPTPVTVYRPDAEARAHPAVRWEKDGQQRPAPGGLPVVVIAHGFAGSQQLMQSFAFTLARNGYFAVTFDYYGHGRNLKALGGDVTDVEGSTRFLLAQTREVVDFALTESESLTRPQPILDPEPEPDPEPEDESGAESEAGAGTGTRPALAVLGHSMASDLMVRYAQADPRVDATIAVSLFSPAVTADSPENFLVIVGALEGFLREEALRVLDQVAADPRAGVTYGDFEAGTARRAVFAPGVEHVGVLYSATALRETVAWLDRVFGRAPGANTGYVDRRGVAVCLLLAGLVLLAWPLSRLLPTVVKPPRGFDPGWRELLPAAILPALATPVLLAGFPADFMGTLVGGYLAVHFGLYGLLTALMCGWLWRRRRPSRARAGGSRRWLPALLATVLATGYAAGVLGFVLDRYVTSFAVTTPRLPLLFVMGAGTLAYFLADEWLTRGPHLPRGAHLLTRVCFLASLGIAVALSFEDLFFLLIIAAVIVPYFLLYGLISGWVYRATGDPLVSAVPSAVAFGWTLTVVFPLLAG